MQKMKKGSVIMKELSKRTKTFTDSVIRRMTRIANEYGAINLSQGFPDFDPPQEILNRLSEVAHEDYNQYAITNMRLLGVLKTLEMPWPRNNRNT